MAERISDLSGDERAKRIAELKQKMQESAQRTRAAQSAEEAPLAHVEAVGTVEVPPTTPDPAEALAVATAQPADVAAPPPAKPTPATAPAAAKPSVNGSSPKVEQEPEGPTNADMTRREVFTYFWGAALGLLALEGLGLSFAFMYPRFRAGEFGGVFHIGPDTDLPDSSAAPQPNANGKFWLVTTEENQPKALYMVCTHLGCLYKWESSNGRFECPCHGSKFTHDGFYIEGPAPRSLDYFDVEIVDGQVAVDTGKKNLGNPSSESPAAAGAA